MRVENRYMRHDPEKYLYDAEQAVLLIALFIKNKSFPDYESDALLRSGVERQLIIVGEALNKLSKLAPQMTTGISVFNKIIGFRNMAVHGYDVLNHETVWEIVKTHLPVLQREVQALLRKAEGKS